MKKAAQPVAPARRVRCVVYCRKSSEEGLDQDYNSLDAQRDAGLAYIASQKHEGWIPLADEYVDPGYSGGNMERPALKRLLRDIERGKLDVVVVYKIDRLSRSLVDFSRMVELFDRYKVSFVSVTQQFNSTNSMGRLMLNVLLSFAQYEREITGERIRDKLAASKKKGMWMGGMPPLGYDVKDHRLIVNPSEAGLVRRIFRDFVKLRSPTLLVKALAGEGATSKSWTTQKGHFHPGQRINKALIYKLVRNRIFLGEIRHRDRWYPGQHQRIIDQVLWDKAQAVIAVDPKRRANHSRAKVPFLLKGLLFDADGRALQPTHTRKGNGRLYRYYLSTRELKEFSGASGLPRFPAEQLEALVMTELLRVLRAPDLLTAIPDRHQFDEEMLAAAISQFAQSMEGGDGATQQQLLRQLIERVVIQKESFEIELRPAAILDLLPESVRLKELACG